jgi:hypothetical protein
MADALEMLRTVEADSDEAAEITAEVERIKAACGWFADALNGADLESEIRTLLGATDV